MIRLGAIGDVVRTLPALNLLRKRHPEAYVAWVVEERSLPVLRGQADLDEVILLEREALAHRLSSPDSLFPGLAQATRFGQDLRRRRFDLSLDFQGTFKSGLIALASGARIRAGFGRRWVKEGSFLFNNRLLNLAPDAMHRVRRNVALLEAIGVEARAEEAVVSLPISEADRTGADLALRLASAGPSYVFIYPGSSSRQSYKRYPADRYGEVARLLIAAGYDVIVGTGPSEEPIAQVMSKAAGPGLKRLPPTSLLVMAEVIRRARLFLGGDTGPMHIASMLGVPVVALFGPTDPALNAPWGQGHVVLDACAPHDGRCMTTGESAGAAGGSLASWSDQPTRPLDASVFDTLGPGEVADAALGRLSQTPGGPGGSSSGRSLPAATVTAGTF